MTSLGQPEEVKLPDDTPDILSSLEYIGGGVYATVFRYGNIVYKFYNNFEVGVIEGVDVLNTDIKIYTQLKEVFGNDIFKYIVKLYDYEPKIYMDNDIELITNTQKYNIKNIYYLRFEYGGITLDEAIKKYKTDQIKYNKLISSFF